MNKTLDFISSALFGGGVSYGIGYALWTLFGEINTASAILMLAGLTWVVVAAAVALIGAMVWSVRHVRITIV